MPTSLAEGVLPDREALTSLDFDRAPFTMAWEVTRACAFSCVHCRADAQPKAHPDELRTDEAMALIDDIARFGNSPILVFTGGDPLMRRDLFDLIAKADSKGLRVSLTPTATALVTPKNLRRAREAGVRRVAFSVDGSRAEVHDRFRGFAGAFERSLRGIELAAAEGLPLQINTTATELNVDELEPMVDLVTGWGAVQWSVFFLVPTGRGRELRPLAAERQEEVLEWLCDVAETAPFDVKATAAPQYRRIAVERARRSGTGRALGAGFHFQDGLDRPVAGVNDGRGFLFISHRGEVCPSGFLPMVAGNVRESSIVSIYRDSPLFRGLRDPAALKGKCGECEYSTLCGGSRSRAFAMTGDHLAADPSCPYVPAAARSR